MDCIKEIPTLGMYHLSVYYNQSGANLIYDRKLKKGSGSSIYGLEVAKSMNFSSEFILMANEIRKDIIDFQPLLGGRKSHYNSDLYVEWCGIPGCNRRAIDTHHIKFQETADAEGFIEGTQLHKNHLSNLVPLCKPCHQQVHCTKSGSYRLQINGYITTESGVVLDFERIKNE
jgi:DNA mismatch repair protein MutS